MFHHKIVSKFTFVAMWITMLTIMLVSSMIMRGKKSVDNIMST